MKFNAETLSKTSKRFEAALSKKALGLPFTKSCNVWAQILFKKNYSAAMAHAKANGSISVGKVTGKSICSALLDKGRIANDTIAIELFAEAIEIDLPSVSEYFSKLPHAIKQNKKACLMSVSGDRLAGIGFIQGDIPGYLPISDFVHPLGQESEMEWIRSNSDFVVEVSNLIGGINYEISTDLFFENHRAGSAKSDRRFMTYIHQNAEEICTLIAKEITAELDQLERAYWEDEFSFDEIKDIGFDVLERRFRKLGETWLKPDCNAGDAVINHVAGSVRETLKMLSNDDRFYHECENVEETIASSALFATRSILDLRKTASQI